MERTGTQIRVYATSALEASGRCNPRPEHPIDRDPDLLWADPIDGFGRIHLTDANLLETVRGDPWRPDLEKARDRQRWTRALTGRTEWDFYDREWVYSLGLPPVGPRPEPTLDQADIPPEHRVIFQNAVGLPVCPIESR